MSERGPSPIAKPLKTMLALAVVALAAVGITIGDLVPEEVQTAVERLRAMLTPTTAALMPVRISAAGDAFGSTTWYFAQGKAQSAGDTWLLLANPGSGSVTATIRFFGSNGLLKELTASVPAMDRTEVHVDQYLGHPADLSFSTVVTASGPIVAEQSVFFTGDGYTTQGVAAPGTSWFLPEGTTSSNYDTTIHVFNPSSSAVDVGFTFYDENGGSRTVSRSVAGQRLWQADLTELCTELSGGVATVVTATAPVIVQRVTLFANGAGGHASPGAPAPSASWYFPLARAGSAYDTWLMLLNPTSSAITVTATYQSASSATNTGTYTLPAHCRKTIWVDNPEEDRSPAADFGIALVGTGAFVAESVVYASDYREGEAYNGATGTANTWYFSEGSTADPYTTYLALYNPGTTGALVTSALLPAPTGASAPTWALSPGQLTLVNLNGKVSSAGFGIAVYSDVPIVAARLMCMPNGMLGSTGLPAAAVPTTPVAFLPNVSAPRTATGTPTATPQPGASPTPVVRAGISTYMLARPIDGSANCGSTGLKGYILDADGNPVQGERVRVWADGWAGGLSNESDANGYWDFTLGTGAIAGSWYAAVSDDDGNLLSPTALMPTSSNCTNGQQWIEATWKLRTGSMPDYYLAWSRHLSCEENGGNHHLFLDVTDAGGQGLASITVRVAWGSDVEDVTTGNKLDIGPGRVEFAMYKGSYTARVYSGSSDTASDLSNLIADDTTCTNSGNTLYHNSYHVVFRRSP